jgi:hypothetical protein
MQPIQGNYVPTNSLSGSALQGGSGSGISLQGSSPTLQSGIPVIQGSSPTLQGSNVNPQNLVDPTANGQVQGAPTTVDPATAAAQAQAAANAAQASQLRDHITGLAQTVKDIYNGRYGQVDQSANEQTGKLGDRFQKESGQLEQQVGQQNDQTGAAFAGNGVYDSSYRGNAQDQITTAGNNQIGALGDELKNNLATIAQWVQQQKAGYDAGKGSMDTIVGQLASETNPTNLISLRDQIDNQIATLQGQSADNNTEASNLSQLEQIAPSSARTQQLQTTLQSILGGNADPTTKAALGGQLIASAQISPEDQSKLLQAFHADIGAAQPTGQQQPQVA